MNNNTALVTVVYAHLHVFLMFHITSFSLKNVGLHIMRNKSDMHIHFCHAVWSVSLNIGFVFGVMFDV